MIFVSRYTEDGAYPEYAHRLRKSLKRFELPHDIRSVPKTNTWAEFGRVKPTALYGVIITTRRPVCWLDCDCEIVRLPSLLLNEPHDFAVYNWGADPESTSTPLGVPNFSGGVVGFGYTAPALELLVRWRLACQDTSISDDKALSIAYARHMPPTRNLWLPKSYNRMDSMWPHVEPVIDHHYTAGGHAGHGFIQAAHE